MALVPITYKIFEMATDELAIQSYVSFGKFNTWRIKPKPTSDPEGYRFKNGNDYQNCIRAVYDFKTTKI